MNYIVLCDGYSYTQYYNEHSESKYSVNYVYDNLKLTGILLILNKIHKRLYAYKLMSLSSLIIWFGLLFKQIKHSPDDTCIIIYATLLPYIPVGVLKKIKNKYHKKIVIQFTDTLESLIRKFNIHEIKQYADLILTYNTDDVKKYGFTFSPPQVPVLKNLNRNQKIIDVFYIGHDKGRGALIERIYNDCIDAGLICDFNIVGPTTIANPGIHKTQPMKYKQVLDKVASSRAVLNIMQPGSNGVTLRDIEAYNYGISIITNNQTTELRDILHEDQVIMIDSDDYKSRIKNIHKNKTFTQKETKYSYDKYYERIDELLNI